MNSENLKSFYADAAIDIAGIRNGILVFVQDRQSIGELDPALRSLNGLKCDAGKFGLTDIEGLASECEGHVDELITSEGSAADACSRRALDNLASIEASLLTVPLKDGDFWSGLVETIDESFDKFQTAASNAPASEGAEDKIFDVDEETMEIFRSEAAELLANISESLRILAAEPQNRDALWKIRRAAHTFKGAAGIVGMDDASQLAHRVEDLLDQLAELKIEADQEIVDLLTVSTDYLNAMAMETSSEMPAGSLVEVYAGFDRVIAANTSAKPSGGTEPSKSEEQSATQVPPVVEAGMAPPSRTQIVRVSLDRLDELLKISQDLIASRAALADRFQEFSVRLQADRIGRGPINELDRLFEGHLRLANELQDKLVQIRMVRFGMLATRLSRTVQVTCSEEDKLAEVVIENQDTEIDTQILDALVEPLLHLIRNAVVHGIEPPERRRMIGKSEKGQIRIQIESNDNGVAVSVSDDGRGISTSRLKERAVTSGAFAAEAAESLTEEEAFDLIFLRGVTTADKLNLNAGRGVGMSIVKESVESRGGWITIDSEPQRGTTFIIKMPAIFAAGRPGPKNENVPELRVLVVDDSASMRQMTTKAVERAGWKAFTAKDGLDAIEFLAIPENRPDIILSDIEMPRLTGFELLEALKSDNKLNDIPVIMISSRSDDAHRQGAFELGAAEYLTKPYEENALVAAIEKLVSVAA